MSEWQLIETAPKDGRIIIVKLQRAGGYEDVHIVRWDDSGAWMTADGAQSYKIDPPAVWRPAPSELPEKIKAFGATWRTRGE